MPVRSTAPQVRSTAPLARRLVRLGRRIAPLAATAVVVVATPPAPAAAPGKVAATARTSGKVAAARSAERLSTTVAKPKLHLSASFKPERLGQGTAVTVAFRVAYPPRVAPLPVTAVRLLYPAGLGLGGSDLGLATCEPAALAARGAVACPRNSLMGGGSARVRVPFGPREVSESASIAIFSQPVQEGHIGLLFAVSGAFPVIADLAFGAFVEPAGGRYGGAIETQLPLVPSVPGGPDVALVALRTTLGGPGILYSERVGRRTVRFHPRGLLLPPSCPRGGFPFAARLTFAGGGKAAASTQVACPRKRGG
jgi:hypothetical protein